MSRAERAAIATRIAGGSPTRPCSTRSGRARSRAAGAPPARAPTSRRRRSRSPTPRASTRSRCGASHAELGLGTMSLYHYVRRQGRAARPHERRDPRRSDRRRRRAARGLARPRCARSRSPRGPTSSATRGSSARCARARGRSRDPTRCATSTSRSPRVAEHRTSTSRRRWRSSRSSTTTSSASCLRAFIAAFEAREEEAEPGLDAGRLRLHGGRSSRPAPTPTFARLATPTARRAAATRTCAAMALDEGRFERGLDRLLDGIEASRPSRSSGVVEDDAERRAPARAHRGHPVAHRSRGSGRGCPAPGGGGSGRSGRRRARGR